MKSLKKTLSILLSLALLLSAITVMPLATSADTPTNYIPNGDFEAGLANTSSDFPNATESAMYYVDGTTAVKVYDNNDTTRQGYGDVDLDGKAAYLPGGVGKDYSYKNNLQYKIVNLPAGKYTLTADVLAYVQSGAKNPPIFYYAFSEYWHSSENRVYGRTMLNYDTTNKTLSNYETEIYNNTNSKELTVGTGVTLSRYGHTLYGSNDYVNQDAWNDLDLTVTFTITEAKTLYLFFGFGTSYSYGYVDNVSLTEFVEESTETNYITNGDFANGLDDWEYSANKGNANDISVTNGVLYIPERTATGTSGVYNRYVNQKVILPAGSYKFSFDADVTFASASNTAFCWAIRTKIDSAQNSYGRPNVNTGDGIANAMVSFETTTVINTADPTEAKNFDESCYKKSSSDSLYFNAKGIADGRYVGKIITAFTLTEETTLWFSIGCGTAGAYGYFDNVSLIAVEPEQEDVKPTIALTDNKVLTFETEDDFKLLNIAEANQTEGNTMKAAVEADANDTTNSTNVLKLPSFVKDSDKTQSARFYVTYTGLTVGDTYTVNFDMKMPLVTTRKAMQWLGLGGVSTVEPQIDQNKTFPNGKVMQPQKLITYTDKGTATPISLGAMTNWNAGVFQWNDTGSENWINYSIDFVAEGTEAYFYIENYLSGISDFYVDNIKITEAVNAITGAISLTANGTDSVDAPSNEDINVLVIGNSFGYNTVREQMLDVINAGSANVNFARYGKGAMSTEYFANQIKNERVNMEFTYARKGNEELYTCAGVDAASVKRFAEWDYIFIQAFSTSERENSALPNISPFATAVKNNISSADTKVIVYVPWSVSQAYCDENYDGKDALTYKENADVLAGILASKIESGELEADGVFSMNEPMWIARKFVGAEGVHADGLHLNATGSYIVALSMYNYLTGIAPKDINVTINSDFYINNALKVSALSVMLGDTDNDGELGEGDISAMRNHLLDISSVAKADSANINCDKDIDICDLVALSNHLLNYPAAKELKILALGNSYSVDGMSYLWNILTDAGVENVTLGNLAIGGCSIDSHWKYISNKGNEYNYFKNTSGEWKLTEDVSIETALLEEDWDIITVQQASIYSGQPDTYENLSNVLNYIENNKTNKDAKIFWHMTWAYQQDHESTNFEKNYNSDQMTMYNAIVNAVNSKVITNELIDGLIPSGTTIQNMRTSYLGDTLTRDGTHLSENYGRYAAGLTWMKAITGISPSEVDWVPTSYSYLSEHKNMIDEAVNSAIETPFAVTNSTYTEAP